MNATLVNPDAPPVQMDRVDVVSLHAPDLVVLEAVNWTVAAGDYWVIGAPPGSGKSALLSTAAGLVRPHSGVHRLFGQELSRLHEQDRLRIQRRAGVVFGFGGRLFNHLTVAQNLALPLCYHENCSLVADQERVQLLLHEVGLTQVAGHLPMYLNRNLRQRTALARALVLSPELLFLDYPLVGIDAREVHWWLDFLHRLRQKDPLVQGRTVTLVVSTDDLQHWRHQPCQYGLIQKKQFLPIGSREELLRRRNQLLPELLPPDWLKE
jgi:ABC-type transporter Mla maintaining outer membrane lipid asymmetry ATPase subunit MlaF